LLPPPIGAEPEASLRWVRRMEIATGIVAIAFGFALWNEGWWHWLLIGVGVSGLSPWPGAATILRKAETHPEVLVADPERRRERARRTALLTVPVYLVVGVVIGYLLDGARGALLIGSITTASGALAAWLLIRRTNE
jgi:cytochrome c biogenesis protein CcdA